MFRKVRCKISLRYFCLLPYGTWEFKSFTFAMKTSLYADLQEKLITQEQFNRYREIYSNKLSEIAQAIKVQEATVKSIYENGIAAGQWLDEFRENMEIEKLDRMLLISLIDKILVYEDKTVEIVFKYRNEMAKAVDLIKGELEAKAGTTNADAEPVGGTNALLKEVS